MPQFEYRFKVDNVSCPGCGESILKLISGVAPQSLEIEAPDFDFSEKELHLYITTELSEESAFLQLKDWLRQRLENSKFKLIEESNSNAWGAGLGLGLGMLWTVISLGWLLVPAFLNTALVYASCGILTVIAAPFLKSAWAQMQVALRDAKNPWFNMDSLFVLSGFIVTAVSIASVYLPIFSCMLEAGFLIFGFRHLGCLFQGYLDRKIGFTRPYVQKFKSYRFQQTNEEGEAIFDLKAAKEFKEKEFILCNAGDVIPIDGILQISRQAVLKDHIKSGSLLPIDVKIGSTLEAGTVVEQGSVVVEITALIDRSRFHRIDDAMQRARSSDDPAPILEQVQRWLQWFIPGLLVLTAISGVAIGYFFSIGLAVQCMVSILVSACPCTLGLIIPMALTMGASKSASHQVFFKSGKAFQQAANTDIFVIDYNGTLTAGKPEVKSSGPGKSLEIIKYIETRMLAMRSNNIGKAIAKHVESQNECQWDEEPEFTDLNYGAKLKTREGVYWFGNNALIAEQRLAAPQEPLANRYYLYFQAQSKSTAELLNYLDVEDGLRPDARDFIQYLKDQKKQIVICTGADVLTTQKIQAQLNIDAANIIGGCDFKQKKAFITELRDKNPGKKIAFLGDGVNDSVAMKASHLSIWIKNNQHHSAFNSSEGAAVEIHSDDLMSISRGLQIAEQTFLLIQQNLMLSFAYNFLVLSVACGALLAFGIVLHPAMGVTLMIVQSAMLALNVYKVYLQPVDEVSQADFSRNNCTAT